MSLLLLMRRQRGFGGGTSLPSTNVLVGHAGSDEVNGTYTPRGTSNDRTYWNLEGAPNDPQFSSIYWDGSNWLISLMDASVGYANNGENVSNPWDSAEWDAIDGAEPPPAVTQG